jgi:hypothetical protein
MALTPKQESEVALQVYKVYADSEVKMMKIVADRLAKGLDSPSWADDKLAEITQLKKQMIGEVKDLSNQSNKTVMNAVETAYKNGSDSASQDLIKGLVDTEIKTSFTGTNEKAVKALVGQATKIIQPTYFKILRDTQDDYRSVINEVIGAKVTEVVTRRQATQLALNKFADKGITSFTDKAGRNWSMSTYAEMATRTTSMNAALQGHIDRMLENDYDLIIISYHDGSCPLCGKWQGDVLSITGKTPGYSTLSQAQGSGLFHPNCGHTLTAYFPGISTPPKNPKYDDTTYNALQKQRAIERKIRYWKKREAVAIDPQQQLKAKNQIGKWQKLQREHVKKYGLDRMYERESIKVGTSKFADQKKTYVNKETKEKLNNTLNNKKIEGADMTTVKVEEEANISTKEAEMNASGVKSESIKAKEAKENELAEKMQATTTMDKVKGNIIDAYKNKSDDDIEYLKTKFNTLKNEDTKKIVGEMLDDIESNTEKVATEDVVKEAAESTTNKKAISLEEQVKNSSASEDMKFDLLGSYDDVLENHNPNSLKFLQETFSNENNEDVKYIVGEMLEKLTGNKYNAVKEAENVAKAEAKAITNNVTKVTKADDLVKKINETKMTDLEKELITTSYEEKDTNYLIGKAKTVTDTNAKNIINDMIHSLSSSKEDPFAENYEKKPFVGKKATDIIAEGEREDRTLRYSDKRRDSAYWCKQKKSADDLLREQTGDTWRAFDSEERKAAYYYTAGSGMFNRPLRGFDRSWDTFKGVGKVSLDNEGGASYIKTLTEAIDKSSYDFDIWLQRGVETKSGAAGFLGITESELNLSEGELEEMLLDKVVKDEGFMSTGASKGSGFTGSLIVNIYAPKGTKMIYAEPFSQYGKCAGLSWDGYKGQSQFGEEFEVIIQRGYTYKITNVTKTGNQLFIDVDVLETKV